MAKEIERKFLVKDNSYASMANASVHIRQAYISAGPGATVRVRVKGDQGYITVKGRTLGCVRDEWEYPIPESDADQMATALAGGWAIDKTRHLVPWMGLTWEVDEFHGRHSGLVLAEVEIPTADTPVTPPPFAAEEVTGDARYYNSSLARL